MTKITILSGEPATGKTSLVREKGWDKDPKVYVTTRFADAERAARSSEFNLVVIDMEGKPFDVEVHKFEKWWSNPESLDTWQEIV